MFQESFTYGTGALLSANVSQEAAERLGGCVLLRFGAPSPASLLLWLWSYGAPRC